MKYKKILFISIMYLCGIAAIGLTINENLMMEDTQEPIKIWAFNLSDILFITVFFMVAISDRFTEPEK